MNSQWNEKNLNELYEFSSGLSKPSEEFGFGFPFLSFKTIFYNYYIDDELDELVNSTKKEQKTHSIKKGDVFLTRTSETLDELGMSCVALKDYPEATFNGFTKRLRPKYKKIIYPLYACYYFRSSIFRKYVDSMAIMTTRASLNNNILSKLPIFFPSYDEQKKIGYLLHNLSLKIELNKKINNHLDELCHLIFKYYFIDFMPFKSKGFIDSEIGEIPEGWKIITVGDILDCKLGGTPSRSNESYWGGDIAWINSGKVNEFRIIEPSEYITELGLKKSATKLLPAKTTVIAITGATLGQISLLEIDSCANQSVIGVIPNNKYPYEFVYPLISSILLDLLKHQTGGAQQHINKNNLESFNIVCPPADIISEYKNIVSSLYSQISANCFEIENLQKLRDTLLPKLMSGEIDVSKINYDLKRIIRKFILTLLNYLYENKNYFKNTKSNETLLKSRTIHKIDKYFTKFIRGYRYY
ncbi:restriction endonuclease subunit S [Methanobrevibacter sp.]|uniref:restriction endonuclease subunit S n=1 Tax=Methanobrevibacter sp. TaxID=66852 RepID=UPI00386F7C05